MRTTNKLLALLLFSIVFVFSCNKNKVAKQLPPNIDSYLYAYTSGTISKQDPIKIRFAKDVVSQDEVGNIAKSSILSFSPSIDGDAIWEDRQTLSFQPKPSFKSGTKYIANVQLGKLFKDVGKDAKEIEFEFTVKELFVNVDIDALLSMNPNSLKEQKIKGNLSASDYIPSNKIENLLVATQNGKNLPIKWSHDDETHTFWIENIIREDKESKVLISWDGSKIGTDASGKRNYMIPAIGDFKVIDSRVVNSGTPAIILSFSDPLLKNQNLNGLVKIKNYSNDLKFDIDGNQLTIYPGKKIVGNATVEVSAGIKNIEKTKMKHKSEWDLSFTFEKPQLRVVNNGVIIPSNDGLIYPFEAISLKSVVVEIFKIYDNNILQFLQTNSISGSNQLTRVGKIVLQKKIDLQKLNKNAQSSVWKRYALNLGELFKADPNAIYQIRIGFRPEYSTFPCDSSSDLAENEDDDYYDDEYYDDDSNTFSTKKFKSIMGSYYGINGYYNGYRWDHREDPCFPAYYRSEQFISSNVISSDLGIIAKSGRDGSVFVAVSNINSTATMANVELAFYDYQRQLIKKVTTASDGTVNTTIPNDEVPFVVIATKGEQKGYLKFGDGNALSLSKFDVGGAQVKNGLKGYFYGDRGVWRPGDSLFLNFVLEDLDDKLPKDYPIKFEFLDPRGQVQYHKKTSSNLNGIYPLYTATDTESPTGNWTAKVQAGGATFSKTIKVETIKPNRLKIDMDFGKGTLMALEDGQIEGDLQVNWLHGAPGKNLNAKVEVQVQQSKTKFDKFSNYNFDDPTRKISNTSPKVIFDGNTDANGFAKIKSNLNVSSESAGKLRLNFKVRAFEKGGDFSTDIFSKEYSPYNSYSGIQIEKNKYNQQRFDIDKDGTIHFVSVDANGNPLQKKLRVALYRVNWRWWWDHGRDEISKYNSSSFYGSIKKSEIQTNSNGMADWTVKVDDWGRYLVRVCDDESGHCTGTFFYAGYPWYRNGNSKAKNAEMLAFTSDKQEYNVGETIELNIPTGTIGKALISIESGTKVVETYWMDAKKGDNKFTFYATAEMAPNVYANVTLLQPHGQLSNDRPIRMYGVIPIKVLDPKTKISPVIKMNDVLEPEQEIAITVSEKNGNSMAYTIDLVDDGLLDLTRFKTPNPWNSFFKKEALGVKTWDIYDDVVGKFNENIERILSVGGGLEGGAKKGSQKANRFKPVVKHLGPFYIEKGQSASHKITMPNYVGSVRTMVVAVGNGAYGSAEKTTPVRKPLMVLATLPRMLGIGEKLTLPVNVFAMEKKIKNVTVTLKETSGLVHIENPTQQIQFNEIGDQIVNFDINVTDQDMGIAKFIITATGSGEKATQEIELDVRNPNPYVTNIKKKVINGQDTWSENIELPGMKNTNETILEISSIPPLNLGARMKYLLRYPHGCVEQTTSKGFPLLYVNRLIDMDEKEKEKSKNIVAATVKRLKLFQRSNGGFSYWPGSSYENNWASNYAGHFLIEAKELGYNVSSSTISNLVKRQKQLARQWNPTQMDNGFYRHNSDLEQAYRLYILAKAGKPEMGSMNRMIEMKNLRGTAKWRLAAAFAIAGKKDIANKLINKLSFEVNEYSELSYTFGSSLRDKAMILETLTILDQKEDAHELLRTIADQISSSRWWSTQSLAYGLISVGKYVGANKIGKSLDFSYQLGNNPMANAGSKHPVMQIIIPAKVGTDNLLKVTNKGQGILFARIISSGQPVVGDQTVAENDLKLKVNYYSTDGKLLETNRLEQGTDFVAEVTIINPGKRNLYYKEMALEQVFPAGWEIMNTRMENFANSDSSVDKPQYQDIRDDRVYTYFGVPNHKSKTFRVKLNAAYQGKFYKPSVTCQAMYDNTISARQPGEWIEVVAPNSL